MCVSVNACVAYAAAASEIRLDFCAKSAVGSNQQKSLSLLARLTFLVFAAANGKFKKRRRIVMESSQSAGTRRTQSLPSCRAHNNQTREQQHTKRHQACCVSIELSVCLSVCLFVRCEKTAN